MKTIFNIFAQSPIKGVEEHMETCYTAAKTLTKLFDALFKKDWPAVEAAREEIVTLENEADEQKTHLRLHLPKNIFLPVARVDLVQLIKAQDKVANRSKDISGIIMGRKMEFPSHIIELYSKYLDASLETVAKAKAVINELDELLETGFRGLEVKLVEKMIVDLDACETKADKLQVDVRAQLFEVEDELKPIDAIFLYKIIDWTGDLSDYAQIIGGQLLLLLAR